MCGLCRNEVPESPFKADFVKVSSVMGSSWGPHAYTQGGACAVPRARACPSRANNPCLHCAPVKVSKSASAAGAAPAHGPLREKPGS